MKIRKYSLPTSKCCNCYISKDLKKQIERNMKSLQEEENKRNGSKSKMVTFSYASKDLANKIKVGGRKWFF